MKKLKPVLKAAAAAAAVLAAGSAMAQQSNVTLYGVLDTYLTSVHPQGAGSVVRMDSSGLLASRWGLRGREDLGGGMFTSFTLESGLNANDGTNADSNRYFNRQAFVGLGGTWGEIRLGRQNTPQFFMNGEFDAFNGATQASGWNNITGTAPRVDNAVGYFSPTVNNIKAQVLWARGALAGAPVIPQTRANQNWHAAVEYKTAQTYLGANYEVVDNQSTPTNTARRLGLGANYAVTPTWRIYGAYGHEKRSDDSLDLSLYSISAGWQLAPNQNLAFGYLKVSDKLSGTGHGGADQKSILYRYWLSKRTVIYTGYADLQQHGLRTSFSLGGAAVVEAGARPTSTMPGGAVRGLQVGINHQF